MVTEQEAADARQQRRQWIRDHHPDRGGDATLFDAGLRHVAGETVPGRPLVRRTRKVRRTIRRLRRRSSTAWRRITRKAKRVL